jgi:hypothetical protein
MKRLSRFLLALAILFTFRSSQAQTPSISYLIPDIGTPGMNTYIEIIAPYNRQGSFGPDSIYTNNAGDHVQVVCTNPSDTANLTFGPVVVSWQGRVISTQVFVGNCSTPNSSDWHLLEREFAIPLSVIVGGVASNSDTFYLVKPQPALIASGGGILGSGGQWGIRSKRGALLFDSIILKGGTYTVSTSDCDPIAPGNQGYLPVTILSKGPVSFLNSANLSVSAIGADAGPGGGGGSMGDGPSSTVGGNGFVGGSPGESPEPCLGLGGSGTGGDGNSSQGGIGLNGIVPEPSDVDPQCEYYGGTGNPFISEGGGVVTHSKHEGDGNGGGFGTSGENGRGERGTTPDLGGVINGNPMLVPLMGGSGGGGGNEFCSCTDNPPGGMAGGGGGGVLLYAPQFNTGNGTVMANGASGVSGGFGCVGHGSVGGSGSGGGITIQSKSSSSFPSVSVAGGISIHTHADAGNGGQGRIRFDGPISNIPAKLPNNATFYRGLSTDTAQVSKTSIVLTGTGNGSPIRIYSKGGNGSWQLLSTIANYSNNSWMQPVSPDPSGITYIVALQQIPNPSQAVATLEPSWIMSQAAANVIGYGSSSPASLLLPTSAEMVTES